MNLRGGPPAGDRLPAPPGLELNTRLERLAFAVAVRQLDVVVEDEHVGQRDLLEHAEPGKQHRLREDQGFHRSFSMTKRSWN